MRYLLVAIMVAAFFLPVSPVLADIGSDDGPGCGLGNILFNELGGGSNYNKVLHQTLAGTTNVIGGQTFAITSGTSGCTNDGFVKNDKKVDVFASVNFENLKEEMAQGQGEYLTSLASLLGVSDKHQPDFFALTQERYESLYKTESTTSGEMLVALNHELASHPTLSVVAVQ